MNISWFTRAFSCRVPVVILHDLKASNLYQKRFLTTSWSLFCQPPTKGIFPTTRKITKTNVELPDGKLVPITGFGLWQFNKPDKLEQILDKALDVGYRQFVTAFSYGNEEIFGHILNRWFTTGKVQRQDLFITTMLPIQGVHPDRVSFFLDLSLQRLQLKYVDLYLIYNPASVQVDDSKMLPAFDKNGQVIIDTSSKLEDTWKVMEAQVIAKKAHYIGMSNFSLNQVERIVKVSTIGAPSILVQLNPAVGQKKLRQHCFENGITVSAFSPFSSDGSGKPNLLTNPIVSEVSKKYKKTPAQILLKFLIQQGITAIPKSGTPERIEENFDIFDFELDSDSMAKLDSLDTGKPCDSGLYLLNQFPGLDKHPEFQIDLPRK